MRIPPALSLFQFSLVRPRCALCPPYALRQIACNVSATALPQSQATRGCAGGREAAHRRPAGASRNADEARSTQGDRRALTLAACAASALSPALRRSKTPHALRSVIGGGGEKTGRDGGGRLELFQATLSSPRASSLLFSVHALPCTESGDNRRQDAAPCASWLAGWARKQSQAKAQRDWFSIAERRPEFRIPYAHCALPAAVCAVCAGSADRGRRTHA